MFKKKWLVLGLCLLLLLTVLLILVGITTRSGQLDGSDPPDDVIEEGGSADSGGNGDQGNEGEGEDVPDTYDPAVLADLVDGGFTMHDSLMLKTNVGDTGTFGLRSRSYASEELYDYVMAHSELSFGTLFIPLDYIATAPTTSDVNWVEWLEENGKAMSLISSTYHKYYDGHGAYAGYYNNSSLYNIRHSNYNRKFTAIAFVKAATEQGAEYYYASHSGGGDMSTFARSPVYLANEALNTDYGVNKLASDQKAQYSDILNRACYNLLEYEGDYSEKADYWAVGIKQVFLAEEWVLGSDLNPLNEMLSALDVEITLIPSAKYGDLDFDGTIIISFTPNGSYSVFYFDFLFAGRRVNVKVNWSEDYDHVGVYVPDPEPDPEPDPDEGLGYWWNGGSDYTRFDTSLLGVDALYMDYYEETHESCGTHIYWYATQGVGACPVCDGSFGVGVDYTMVFYVRGELATEQHYDEIDQRSFNPRNELSDGFYFLESTLFYFISYDGFVPVGTTFEKDGVIYQVTGCDVDYLYIAPLPEVAEGGSFVLRYYYAIPE